MIYTQYMPSEFGENLTPNEKPAIKATELAVERIEDHVKGAELGSPRFQAFADYTDRIHVEPLLDTTDPKNKNFALWQTEYALILETIRQRKNGVKGYKKKYKRAEELAVELGSAIHDDRQKGKESLGLAERLGYIKNGAIDKNGNP